MSSVWVVENYSTCGHECKTFVGVYATEAQAEAVCLEGWCGETYREVEVIESEPATEWGVGTWGREGMSVFADEATARLAYALDDNRFMMMRVGGGRWEYL